MSAWHLIAGLVLIAVGAYWYREQSIPVGIEGEPPSFYLKGRAARVFAILTMGLGLGIALAFLLDF